MEAAVEPRTTPLIQVVQVTRDNKGTNHDQNQELQGSDNVQPRRRVSAPGRAQRTALVILSITSSLLTAGIIFGFQSIRPALLDSGIFAEYCTAEPLSSPLTSNDVALSTSPEPCTEQVLALNWMFALASTATNAASLPIGLLLDRLGPRISSLMGSVLFALGCVLFGVGIYTPGFLFIGLGGPFMFISSLHISIAFPLLSGFVMAALTGAFDASAFVFYVFNAIYEAIGGVETLPIRSFFLAYAAVPLLLGLGSAILMPSVSFGSSAMLEAEKQADWQVIAQERDEVDPLLMRSSLNDSQDTLDAAEVESQEQSSPVSIVEPTMTDLLKQQLLSVHFWGVTLTTCIFMISLNFYISTLKDQLSAMADLTEAEQSFLLQFFNFALPVGGIVSIPAIGYLLNSFSFHVNFTLLSFMGLAYFGAMFYGAHVPVLCIGIVMFVLMRPLMYSLVNAFVIKTFGFRTFGAVYGCMTLLAGCSNMLQYPLTWLSLTALDQQFWVANVLLMIGVGLTLAFPIYLACRASVKQLKVTRIVVR